MAVSDGGVYIWHGEVGTIASGDETTADVTVSGWLDQTSDAYYDSFGAYLFDGGDLD